MDAEEMNLLMQSTMTGASMAVRETEKVRSVFTRFLELRSREPHAPAKEHAYQALTDIEALLKVLSEAEAGGPKRLPEVT